MQGIKTRLHQEGGAWVEELPNVLWAHRTTPKTSNGETPFSLAYGTEAVIPAEIGIPTKRTIQRPDEENKEALRLNLNLLEERREIATIREARRKQQVEKYYNQRVRHKQFKVGEFVLRKNKLSKAENTGKLGPKWEGPYEVVETYGTGAYKLRSMEVSCDVVHFVGSCHEGLSRDETFRTDDLDPPPPFDMNIPTHVSIDKGILSDHAEVQDRLVEELGNENESDDVNYASVNEDTHHEEKDDDDVMINEENEIHKAKVEVHLFGLRESAYQFTNIGVSIEVPDNVFMKKDGYDMDIDDFDTDSCGEGDCPGGRKNALNKLKKAFMQGEGDGSKYAFYCGQVFTSSKEVKDRVYLHSTNTRRELKLVRNDKLRVRATCFDKKPRVYNCITRILVKAVQDILQRELEVHVSMSKAFRAKAKANKEIKASTTVSFEKCMDELKSLNVTNQAWLSRAHIYILLNNLCEVFNGKIVGGRDKPVITLLKYIREYCMKRIVTAQAVIDKCDGPLTPTATRILDSIKKEATYMTVQWNSRIKHQVSRSFGGQCVVDVSNGTCTCRNWEIIGILCKHA
ncbi:reverse transcriptase domain-containing protein [Tanacetum coccineum]|uniref:Reverse transcriptase domain-containing protein n=1 Tax=Tanacetum coccineum TaxID=301880 RepID=A0ABQ5A0J8_9ASTR